MVSIGRGVDRVLGTLSRLLHIRSTRHASIEDLAPYFDAPLDVLLPAPQTLASATRRRGPHSVGRGLLAETLDFDSSHVPLCPRYRVRHEGPYAKNSRFRVHRIFPTSNRRRQALIYIHGWLEPGPWVEEVVLLPRVCRALGVDVVDLVLPFHGRRTPREAWFPGELFLTADLVRSFEAIRQSCFDVRALVQWLRAQGYEQVGVSGISLGGSIAMALACVRPTPDYIVPMMGHLQFAAALEEAPILYRMKSDLQRLGIDRAHRQAIFERVGLDHLLPVLPPSRQLWIMARDDVFVSAEQVTWQWQRWGRPPIEWVPGGHLTFGLSAKRVIERIEAFHAALPTHPP